MQNAVFCSLGAVHNGHERSEFGRMQASRRPNQRWRLRATIIDRVANQPWDELEDPCPLSAGKLARNAQHGSGFYIGLAVRQEGKGTRVIRIDAELLSERMSLGQLDRNEAKIAAAFAHEAAAARS